MTCNVGNTDRAIRIILGVVIIVLGIIFDSWWGLIGLIPLLTGIFRFCALYIPLGISTSKRKQQQ